MDRGDKMARVVTPPLSYLKGVTPMPPTLTYSLRTGPRGACHALPMTTCHMPPRARTMGNVYRHRIAAVPLTHARGRWARPW